MLLSEMHKTFLSSMATDVCNFELATCTEIRTTVRQQRVLKTGPSFHVIPTATVNAGCLLSVRAPPSEDSQNCSRGTRAVEKLTRCHKRIGTIPNIDPRSTSP
jgi:hypothetical protein